MLKASSGLHTPLLRGLRRRTSLKSLMMANMSTSGSSTSGPVQDSIEKKLRTEFDPVHLDVSNESYMHNVPKGSETHFKVTVVSSKFDQLPLLQRHRAVNATLQEELTEKGVHALSIHAKTPAQWNKLGGDKKVEASPQCLGGMKREMESKGGKN